MKYVNSCIQIFLTLVAFILCSESVQASEESKEDDLSGGFLKIGAGYKFDRNPFEQEKNGLSVFLNGRYQMKNGLFVEAAFGANEGTEGLNIGYNFYNITNWNFDVTTVTAVGGVRVEVNVQDSSGEIPPINVTEKISASHMLGLRATGQFGKTNLQFLVAPLLIGNDYDDALYSSFWLGHSWQIKNWEINASTGVEYRSEAIVANFFEPSEALQAVFFPAYDASSGFDFTMQLSTSYPITKNILFESYARYTDYADSIIDSPIVEFAIQTPGRSKTKTELGILFSYVF